MYETSLFSHINTNSESFHTFSMRFDFTSLKNSRCMWQELSIFYPSKSKFSLRMTYVSQSTHSRRPFNTARLTNLS